MSILYAVLHPVRAFKRRMQPDHEWARERGLEITGTRWGTHVYYRPAQTARGAAEEESRAD